MIERATSVKCERCNEKRINLLCVHPKRICHSVARRYNGSSGISMCMLYECALNPIIIGFYDNRQPYGFGLDTNIKLES